MAKKIGTILVLLLALIAILWGMRQLMKPRLVEGNTDRTDFITNINK